jgi:hypothetical protein
MGVINKEEGNKGERDIRNEKGHKRERKDGNEDE